MIFGKAKMEEFKQLHHQHPGGNFPQRNCLWELGLLLASYISRKWQFEWDKYPNKLHEINPSINKNHLSFETMHNQVVYTRCCIGHSRLTHGFLLEDKVPPTCNLCKAPRE